MATGARNRRRVVPPWDDRAEELEGTKQLYTDYFGEVRRGHAQDYDANRRANIIYNIVHPKHGRWRGLEDPWRPGARAPSIYRSRAIFPAAIPQTPGRLGPKAKQRLQDAYSATFRLNQNFTPAHVTFRKILGYGGFGVAALFGLHDSTGRETTVVVKADLRPSTRNFIKTEKSNMILMSGARHVVQRTLLISFPWPKDIPVRYDQLRAAERFIVKLLIFLIKVIGLLLLTTIQAVVLSVAWVVDWIYGCIYGEYELVWEDGSDAADDQDPQPAPAQPEAAEPAAAEPAAGRPGPSRSGSSRPRPSRPQPARPQPGPSRSGAAQPARAQSAPAEPRGAQQARDQPPRVQPAPAQPAPAEPDRERFSIPSMQYWTMKKLWPDWPKKPPRALGIDGAIRQNRIELDAREDIISMEFLKFGDLGKWIGKMTGQNNMDSDSMFSERVAWIIFECLWRGCVALAYPTGFYQEKDPMTTQIPQVNESPETSSVGGGDPLVHFDLDPLFVGDFAADHGLWPVTKIGDLGLSLQPLSQVFDDDIDEESTRWMQRSRGKRDSFLPEQFTEEWDYVPNLDALKRHEVAGNFHAHSNIYHIGLTMFQIITLNLPDEPPLARPYNFYIDRESLSGWTYGHNLLSENNPYLVEHFSAELRNTVAWCMEHNPMERPSLSRLGQIVERNAYRDWADQPDRATRTLVSDLLGTPMPPPPI